jgi:hypothetical protein
MIGKIEPGIRQINELPVTRMGVQTQLINAMEKRPAR